jgi:hypothetical protein
MLGLGLVAGMTVAGGAAPAQAAGGPVTDTVGAYDRGSYSKAVYQDTHVKYGSDPDVTYFSAGRADNTINSDPLREIVRNFFTFELDPTGATVTRAELVLKFNGSAYGSEDDSETFALYDVTSDVDTLVAGGDGTAGLGAIWNDLGSGHKYASRNFTAADQGKVIHIPLDATARLQAANGGKFALGGAITTLGPRPAGTENGFWNQLLFSFSGGDFASLELTYAGSQPDGQLLSGSGNVGYGVINDTATGQTLTRSAAKGKTITFTLTIWNAEGISDRYKILADGSAKGYKVRYLWNGTDITSAVVGDTYRTPAIDPATSADLTIKVTVLTTATAGSSVARRITIQSAGDHRSDVIKAIARRG